MVDLLIAVETGRVELPSERLGHKNVLQAYFTKSERGLPDSVAIFIGRRDCQARRYNTGVLPYEREQIRCPGRIQRIASDH